MQVNKACDIRWGLIIKSLKSNQQGLNWYPEMNREPMKRLEDWSNVLLVPMRIFPATLWTMIMVLQVENGGSLNIGSYNNICDVMKM